MKNSIVRLTALSAALLLPALAAAQAPPSAKPPIAPKTEQLDPKACAPSDTQATVGQGGDLRMEQKGGGSLSDNWRVRAA